jgi:uncharacterized protein (DUF2336 family)
MDGVVTRFLTWSRGAPVAGRVGAARALARAYLTSELSPEEREQVETAMTVLLDDQAVEVRLVLADALGKSQHAPAHIIMTLATDAEPVALIVAEHSPVILDSELVDMAATRGEAMQIAIASRPFLSRAVSAALGEVGSAEACRALVINAGARVPRFTLDRIVGRHGDCPELRLALLERKDLPLDVRQVLLGKLAGALRDLIVGHGWTTPERAAAVTDDARECATIAASFEAPVDNLPALVAQLMEGNALTPAFLIRAVAAGQALLFETALSMLARVPKERVAALVASGRTANLRALLQKAGLPHKTFPAFSAAIDVIRQGEALAEPGEGGDYRRAAALIDAIVTKYQRRPDRELDQILALLRRFARDAKRAAARDYAEQIRAAA